MKEIQGKIYIIFLILFLASCTPPPLPKPKPANDVTIDSPNIIKKENNQHLSLKRLQSTLPELKGQNYSLVIKFYENYIIEEHEMTFVSHNLNSLTLFILVTSLLFITLYQTLHTYFNVFKLKKASNGNSNIHRSKSLKWLL